MAMQKGIIGPTVGVCSGHGGNLPCRSKNSKELGPGIGVGAGQWVATYYTPDPRK
jgi:hypothetical protein